MRIEGVVFVGAVLAIGCESGAGGQAAASASASAPAPLVAVVPSGSAAAVIPPEAIPEEKIRKVMNPNGLAPYAGKTATLRGTVRIKGDKPPPTDLKFPAKCGEAAATYGKLFRLGQDGVLADTMVTVTPGEKGDDVWPGYVPPAEEAKKITIHGCAFSRRTLVAAFGQRIEIYNLDKLDPYMPFLDGADFRAVMAAIPGGDAVRVYPREPGHYVLRDQLPNPFLEADVFVLKYATHDVTGLDGQYEIKGIPVGKVHVDAFLPVADVDTGQTFELKEGDNTLDLTLEFSKAKFDQKKKPKGPPKPPPSAPPGPKG